MPIENISYTYIKDKVRARVVPNIQEFVQTQQIKVWMIAVALGVVVALAAAVFRFAIGAVQWLWLGDSSEAGLGAMAENAPWYLLFFPPIVGGVFVAIFIVKFCPIGRPEGVADVIEGRAKAGEELNMKRGISSALVTVISLGFGASAGREGPMIHLGASLSAWFYRHFDLSLLNMKMLYASGVAAAISASFNAPIAGVIFAHEVILQHYSIRTSVPIVIASTIASVIARLIFGDDVVFTIPSYQITSVWEFPAFILLGITCAIVAILFQLSLIMTDWFSRQLTVPVWIKPITAGILIGAIALYFPQVLGVGYAATDAALNQQLPIMIMIGLIFAKTIATSITLAGKFGGGIFSPALYVGAMAGGSFGLIAAQVFPEMASSHGLYAILGMAAVSAAVLGAPFSTTLIVFELTGGYALSIALLLTVSIATGLHLAVHGRSFFHYQLEMRGQFLQQGPHREVVRIMSIQDFMTRLPYAETRSFDPTEEGPYLLSTTSMEVALQTFDTEKINRLPVVSNVSKDNYRLVGWATHVDAMRSYNAALISASQEEHR